MTLHPVLKQGDYYGGLNAATDDLIKYMKGEYKASGKTQADTDDGDNWGAVFALVVIVVVVLIIIFRGRGGRWRRTYNRRPWRRKPVLVVFWAVQCLGVGSGGWGGFSGGDSGSGGSDSGGFGGFGGGDFGGGGSSGSW